MSERWVSCARHGEAEHDPEKWIAVAATIEVIAQRFPSFGQPDLDLGLNPLPLLYQRADLRGHQLLRFRWIPVQRFTEPSRMQRKNSVRNAAENPPAGC